MLRLLGDLISARMLRDAERLRGLLRGAQLLGRVLSVGGSTAVIGAAQVREVFERDREFRFGAPSDLKMKLGPFILGMDDSPAYQHQKRALRSALTSHYDAFAPIVRAASADAAAALDLRREVDLLAGFVDPVVTRFSSAYYGVPFVIEGVPARSRILDVPEGEGVLGGWLRVLGGIIVSSSPAPFGLEQVADAVAVEFRAHLAAAVEVTKPALPGEFGSVIAQLKALGTLEHDELASSVGGLMLAGRTVGRSFLFALHQLLSRRDAYQGVLDAVAVGDRELVLGHMLEGLRFQPPFAFLPRYVARQTTLATGTADEAKLSAGSSLLISPFGAMHDPQRVTQPDDFNPHRPHDVYMHYGVGRHACLGDWIASIALTEMAMALLSRRELAGATAGVFRHRGPLVDSYRVKPHG